MDQNELITVAKERGMQAADKIYAERGTILSAIAAGLSFLTWRLVKNVVRGQR